jgi:peptidoglycan LD-endopeptidase LytH
VGTPVVAWKDGTVLHSGYNAADGDYGNVIITEHVFDHGVSIYSLYGHLDANTLEISPVGRQFKAGEKLGGFGARHENGGWSSHVHFQLAIHRPETHDMPGVVARADRETALISYPDPRLIVGPLF